MALPSDQPMPQASEKPAGALNSIPVKAPTVKGGMPVVGNIQLGPDETKDILAQMQQMVGARETVDPSRLLFSGGPAYNTIQNSLKDVAAWASGGVKGPGEGLALRDAEKAREAKDLFEMRTQMAAYKSAQKQAENAAANIASNLKGGPGTAGVEGAPATGMTYGGIAVPEGIQAQLKGKSALEQQGIIDKWLGSEVSEDIKLRNNPAAMTRNPVVVWNPIKKEAEVRDVNMLEYQDLKSKGLIKQPSEYYEAKPTAPSTTTPTSGSETDVLPRLQKAVFSTESTSGKADTSKPGIQGAIGPMQITQETFDTAKRLKLIPTDYDINNKEHNKDTGNKLIEYYYNKYDKNPDKALAAYHGGEGAINKDGTINLERKDKLGTSIGQYIAMNKAKAGLQSDLASKQPGVQVASTGQGFPDVANIVAQRKIAEEEQTAAAKKRGESGEVMRTSFENEIDPGTLSDNYATSRRIQTLVKNDPTLSGVLTGPGYAKAVGTVLEKGIGNFGIQALDDAIYQTLPNTTNLSAAERKELSTYLAKIELQAAKLIKGQGQITEGEREILQRASSSIKDPAELIYKKARVIERVTAMNEKLADIYGDGGKYTNFRQFKNDPEFKRIHAEFRGDLENILNEKADFTKKPVGASSTIQEGAESTSKSGKPIVYRNGKWEYK